MLRCQFFFYKTLKFVCKMCLDVVHLFCVPPGSVAYKERVNLCSIMILNPTIAGICREFWSRTKLLIFYVSTKIRYISWSDRAFFLLFAWENPGEFIARTFQNWVQDFDYKNRPLNYLRSRGGLTFYNPNNQSTETFKTFEKTGNS